MVEAFTNFVLLPFSYIIGMQTDAELVVPSCSMEHDDDVMFHGTNGNGTNCPHNIMIVKNQKNDTV